MNVLEKILEEIEEYEKKKCSGESLSAFESGINRGCLEAKNIIRSHMGDHPDIDVEEKYILCTLGEDGVLSEYDDTYDVTIHCSSKEDQDQTIELIKRFNWIPVSERLPEEGEKCVITDKCGYVHDGIIYDYAYNKDENPSFHRWDDEYWQCFRPDVIAWQPLPDPYKPEEDKP